MINTITMSGNLIADCDQKSVKKREKNENFTIVNFTIAHNYQGREAEIIFMPVTVFGAYAEAIAQHLTKGKGVVVSGTLREDSFEDKDKKRQRKKWLEADSVQLC